MNTLSNQDKLIESSNSIYSELREAKWLYNPVVYSQISGDFTLMQQRILIGILEKLQKRIMDSVDSRNKQKLFPAIFDDSELKKNPTLELNISAADLGVGPDHYGLMVEAVDNLGKITMKYPKFDAKGKVMQYVIAPLFSRMEMAMTESKLRRTGVLRIVMLTENIRDIFNMQYGFVKHVSHIARIALKKRTPRLYIYLSRFKDVGHKKVPYADLIEFLGLTDEYYLVPSEQKKYKKKNKDKENCKKKENKIPVENPYKYFAKVKLLVLDPVKKEMDELAAKGEINFSFDYEPIYPQGKSRGTPLEVLFTIKNSDMGNMKSAEDQRTNSIYNFIDTYVSWCPDLSIHALRELIASIPEKKLQPFISFALSDVRRIVECKQPDDVASYVMGILRKWKRENIRVNQPTLFDALPTEPEQKEDPTTEVPGQYAAEWKAILDRYDGVLKSLLLQARHFGTSHGFILIYFPTREQMEAYNKAEKDNPNEEKKLMVIMRDVLGDAGRILKRGVDPQKK